MLINFNKKLFTSKYKKYIKDTYNKAIDIINPACKDLEVNVAFVSKKEIQDLNVTFRQVDRVTDVLSFPTLLYGEYSDRIIKPNELIKTNFIMDINEENGNIILGDIYICLPVCFEQAKEYSTGVEREVSYLALHGLLHLLGYDHIEEDDKKIMRAMEDKILGKLEENQWRQVLLQL